MGLAHVNVPPYVAGNAGYLWTGGPLALPSNKYKTLVWLGMVALAYLGIIVVQPCR